MSPSISERSRKRRELFEGVSSARQRRGVVTLELILVFPIFFILFLAVIEFGLIYASVQHVVYSSRFGAKLAAQEPPASLDDLNGAGGGSRLRTAIDNYLVEAGLSTGSCRIILEHNAMGISNPVQTDGPPGATCDDCYSPTPQPLPAPPSPDPPLETPEQILAGLPLADQADTDSSFVRVTVCVPIEGNVPDLLCYFGFSIEDCEFTSTTTFRYENCTPPPPPPTP